jgi:transposase
MKSPHSLRDLFSMPGFTGEADRRLRGPVRAGRIACAANNTAICSQCGHRCRGRYDQRLCRARDLSRAGKRVYLEFGRWRVDCPRCQSVRVERLGWLAKNPRYTQRFAMHVGGMCPAHDEQGGGGA